jgi:hypothetical protein
MAIVSVQQKIAKAQREAAVEHTALKIAVYGTEGYSRNQMPATKMIYNDAFPEKYTKPKTDLVTHQVWAIEGRDPDEISLIMQQLLWLWYKEDVRAVLNPLGFVGYTPTNVVGPGLTNGVDRSGGLMGVIEFDVRMTINNPF